MTAKTIILWVVLEAWKIAGAQSKDTVDSHAGLDNIRDVLENIVERRQISPFEESIQILYIQVSTTGRF